MERDVHPRQEDPDAKGNADSCKNVEYDGMCALFLFAGSMSVVLQGDTSYFM